MLSQQPHTPPFLIQFLATPHNSPSPRTQNRTAAPALSLPPPGAKNNPQIRDQAPKGATVLFGQKEKQNEAMYDGSAATPHKGLAAGGQGGEAAGGGAGVTTDSPAGDEEHMRATGARGDKVL